MKRSVTVIVTTLGVVVVAVIAFVIALGASL